MTFNEWKDREFPSIDDTWVLAMMERAWNGALAETSDKQETIGYVNIRALTQLAKGQWAIINPTAEGDATHPVFTKDLK